jgi:uncharacterized protein YigA (DUF484 family)
VLVKLIRTQLNQIQRHKDQNDDLTQQIEYLRSKLKHEEGHAYKLMKLVESMKDTLKRITSMLGYEKTSSKFDDVVDNAFEFWNILFADNIPELPEMQPLDALLSKEVKVRKA